MAFEPKIKYKGLHPDNTFSVEDVTGLYDETDNEGGYGAPNPIRAALALYPVMYQRKYDGSKVPVSFTSFNPLSVASFTGKLVHDGWLDVTVFFLSTVLNVPSDADGQLEGKILYSVDIEKPIILKGSSWSEATTEELFASEEAFGHTDEFPLPSSARFLHTLNAEIVDLGMKYDEDKDEFHEYYEKRHDFDITRALMNAAALEFCRAKYTDQNYFEAQKIIEALNKRINEYK